MNDADFQQRCAETIYIVEASTLEELYVWDNYHERYSWQQVSPGCIETCGSLLGLPVCIDMQWIRVGGGLVCFWHACSRMVDRDMIEAHLKKVFGSIPMTNAMNFHHVCDVLRMLEKKTEGGASA